jgi:hypothetical protein
MMSTPVQPAKASSGNAGWMIGIVCGVVGIGVIFGTLVAPVLFGSKSTDGTAQTSSTPSAKSKFTEAFDDSFKRSCIQTAMGAGRISHASAENYCDCALSSFHETHSMSKASASCKQYIFLPRQ